MPKSQLKRTMEGAFILTIASFIAKVLSAVYRVPFQNLVGDEGFYVYQQVYPIYGLAMTLALSGLPQFISRVIAEQPDPQKQRAQIQVIYPYVFGQRLDYGQRRFLCRCYRSGHGRRRTGIFDPRGILYIPLCTTLTFYRGSFQGNLQMVPTAVSQVVEQLLRVGVILVAASFFHLFSWDVYQTGTLAMSGALIGGLAAWGF